MKMTAAIYARVSSTRQKEEGTVASQTAALRDYAAAAGLEIPADWVFEDEGYSGATLIRPGLERLRDLAAEIEIPIVLCYAADRLARRYAYQALLIEEFARVGTELRFIKNRKAETPEDELLLQFQGMIAEYERAQIAERTRRGKLHRARSGSVAVLSGAPYGYRYVRKAEEMGISDSVKFLGVVSNLGEIIASSHLLLLPSKQEIPSLPTFMPRPMLPWGMAFNRAASMRSVRPARIPVDCGPRSALPPLSTTRSAPASMKRVKCDAGGMSDAVSTRTGTPASLPIAMRSSGVNVSGAGGLARFFAFGGPNTSCFSAATRTAIRAVLSLILAVSSSRSFASTIVMPAAR